MNCLTCQSELRYSAFAIVKMWDCPLNIYIDGKSVSHYKKLLYNTGYFRYEYLFGNFYIFSFKTSCDEKSLIKFIKPELSYNKEKRYCVSKKLYVNYSLIPDNKELINNKLKLYNTFS